MPDVKDEEDSQLYYSYHKTIALNTPYWFNLKQTIAVFFVVV